MSAANAPPAPALTSVQTYRHQLRLIRLARAGGMHPRDIASAMGLSAKTVKRRLRDLESVARAAAG